MAGFWWILGAHSTEEVTKDSLCRTGCFFHHLDGSPPFFQPHNEDQQAEGSDEMGLAVGFTDPAPKLLFRATTILPDQSVSFHHFLALVFIDAQVGGLRILDTKTPSTNSSGLPFSNLICVFRTGCQAFKLETLKSCCSPVSNEDANLLRVIVASWFPPISGPPMT